MNDLAASAVDQPRVWHDDTLLGVVWMAGASSEYRVEPVDEYVIGVTTGSCGYQLQRGGRTLYVRPGQVVVLDAEQAHRGTQTRGGPWRARMLALPASLLMSLLDEPPPILRSTIESPVIDAPLLSERFLALHRRSQAGSPQLERECALLTLLDDLVPVGDGRPRSTGDPTVADAVSYLRDCFLDPVSLDTLAAATNSDKFRLLRAFRAELGVTPHQFLVSVRVAHARRLLAVGTSPSETAAASGFADQSHLHRHFRDRFGITPGRYRRLAQQSTR